MLNKELLHSGCAQLMNGLPYCAQESSLKLCTFDQMFCEIKRFSRTPLFNKNSYFQLIMIWWKEKHETIFSFAMRVGYIRRALDRDPPRAGVSWSKIHLQEGDHQERNHGSPRPGHWGIELTTHQNTHLQSCQSIMRWCNRTQWVLHPQNNLIYESDTQINAVHFCFPGVYDKVILSSQEHWEWLFSKC